MARGKVIHTHTFSGGIDTSTAPEYKSTNVCEYILNCNSLSTSNGDVGIITNLKGNTIIPTELPSGENIRIGWVADEESNNFYTFLWNSEDYHSIYRYNSLEKRETLILRNLTDTGNVDILRFNKDYLILHADIVRNNLIYWVDGFNNARKFNISKALDKSDNGYGAVILEDYINAYKKTSNFPPTAIYFSDTSKQFNRLYGKLYKFIVRYIYDDGEKSNWSEYSNTPLPDKEPITGISAIPSNNNGIKLNFETGSKLVTHIEIAMQSTDSSATEDGTLNFVTIAILNKKVLNIPDSSTYTYNFYNDGNYSVTDVEKVIRPYSFIPKRPLCQNIVRNALIYWNGWEGFDNVDVISEVTVAYDDLFISSGVVNEFNEPSFVRTAHSVAYVNGPGGDRETYETIAVGSDVKKGNIFTFQFDAPSVLRAYWTYTATAFDTALTVANYFRNILASYDPTKDRSPITVDGLGTASFSYTIRATSYVNGITSVEPIQFNSLKDTGESINNIKLGSSFKLGITYEDEDGRKSLVYTSDSLIVNISTINELGGFKKPVLTLQIKHRPPVWAKYYQIVRSNDLIYQDYIQLLIQDVSEVQGTTDTEYLDLVVGSLFTYQKLHPNSVLKYEFKPADRLRLISWTNPETLDKTFYDFYETEVLSYRPSVETLINETITTTTNSENVVINGVTLADNIGKVILIDGTERTITSVVNGTTYGLSNKMTENKTFLNYTIIDRRGTVRVRKPPVSVISEIKDVSLVEIYTPSSSVSSGDVKTFNEFGIKLPIINWGTETRAHAGISQNQDGTNSSTLSSTPAIIKIDNGTAYVRNRELPLTNNVPGANVLVDSIEDAGYSDFYNSKFNDNGRVTVEDTGDGEVHFGSRARYSNNYIENTRINGLNDFDNLDREDYNDSYGDIVRTLFKENRVYVFKSLKDAWVPVRQSILTEANGQTQVGLSNKLLNDIQYFSYEGGIGKNPESIATNADWIYHVMPNAGVIVRLGGNGVIPISEIYYVDNKVKEYLSMANTYGAKIFGGFDRYNGLYVVAIGAYKELLFKGNINESQWQLNDEVITTTYSLVIPPSNGTVDFTSPTQWTYTPNTDYTGSDFFTYTALIDGAPSSPEKVCITVDPSGLTATAWRAKESSFFCVMEDLIQTGYKGWTTLEEYVLGSNTLTGNEKPNVSSDADYIPPVYDDVTCPVVLPPVTINYTLNNSDDPYVQSALAYFLNGAEQNVYYTNTSGTLTPLATNSVTFTTRSFANSYPWPDSSNANLTILKDGVEIFNDNETSNINPLSTFTFTLEAGSVYTVTATTTSAATGLTTKVLNVNNNSSLNVNNGFVVLEDNTSGDEVIRVETVFTGQEEGYLFNVVDDANLITAILENNSPSAITFNVTSPLGGYNQTIVVPAMSTGSISNVPKSEVTVTLTDAPEVYTFTVKGSGGVSNVLVELIDVETEDVLESKLLTDNGTFVYEYNTINLVKIRITDQDAIGFTYEIRLGVDGSGSVIYSGTFSITPPQIFTTPDIEVNDYYVHVYGA